MDSQGPSPIKHDRIEVLQPVSDWYCAIPTISRGGVPHRLQPEKRKVGSAVRIALSPAFRRKIDRGNRVVTSEGQATNQLRASLPAFLD